MSRIIAIANQKGGVGKTTTCVNVAAALASLRKRVLLVDLDPQGNATTACGIDKNGLERGAFEVLIDRMSIAEARQFSPSNGHDVIGSNSDLTAAEVELMELEQRERRLREALDAGREHYDYILIDCPPSLNILTLNAFVAADSVLVPVQCEYYALEGLSALLETVDGVRESVNPGIEIEGLLRTMYDGRSRLGAEVSDALVENFGDRVFETIVPRNIRLAEAPSHGVSIVQYDRASRGALAYVALAGEMIRRRKHSAATVAAPLAAPVVTRAAPAAEPPAEAIAEPTTEPTTEPNAEPYAGPNAGARVSAAAAEIDSADSGQADAPVHPPSSSV